MNNNTYEEFKEKYQYSLNQSETINYLMNEEIKNYIIKNDSCGCDFLNGILLCDNEQLKNYYFDDRGIEKIVSLNRFYDLLTRYYYYPNKISFFNRTGIFKYLKNEKNTFHFVGKITEELKSELKNENEDIEERNNQLTRLLRKYFDYLKEDFNGNIDYILVFMENVNANLYLQFLDEIRDSLIILAKENTDISFDKIFLNSYLFYKKELRDIYDIASKFKGVDKLYYSTPIVLSMIDKAKKIGKENLNEEETKQFHDYVFTNYAKEVILTHANSSILECLNTYFNEKTIEYFLDDDGLRIIGDNKRTSELLNAKIQFDKLVKSKIFLKILIEKNINNTEDFDLDIKRIYGGRLDNKKSIYYLLNNCIDLGQYEYFYRTFRVLSIENQLDYFKNNLNLLEIENDNIYKGMKRGCYELFKLDFSNISYSIRDLYDILCRVDDYSIEQIECIFSNNKNINEIIYNSTTYYIENMYKVLLMLNNHKLDSIYCSENVLSKLRTNEKIDSVLTSSIETVQKKDIFLNKNTLIDIGEEVKNEYLNEYICTYNKYPKISSQNKYANFLVLFDEIKNKSIKFSILDFYLTNIEYLHTFYVLRKTLNKNDLIEYLDSRSSLITNIIRDNKDYNIRFILGNLEPEILITQYCYERENWMLYCNYEEYHLIFDSSTKYKLSEETLKNDLFIEKFVDHGYDLKEELELSTDNKILINELVSKVNNYKIMKDYIVTGLNDNENEFMTYLRILINSNINIYDIEFLDDMINVIFYNRRIADTYSKYNGIDYESKKLEILNDVKNSSCQDIVNSITNPLTEEIVNVEYELDGEKVIIPTIIYDRDKFTFLVRRMDSGRHINTENHKEKLEYYSTITEKNRSIFYGDSGIKFGYVKVKPSDIVQVNSFDAISQRSSKTKYTERYLKYPEWVSMEELNERTYNHHSYNEIRIYGKYIPDYVISYDEPSLKDLEYSRDNNAVLVKIPRKRYKDAIESCKDPYANWN